MKFRTLVLITLALSANAFAEWKSEAVNGLETLFYFPKQNGLTAAKKALMINLHGCSQKPEDYKKDGNWEQTADEYQMIVALPKVPNGGVYSGCWDYYGADHTEANRHNAPVINLVKNLLARSELNIDPGQVYIAGLSSGGGESMVLGCMAPDLFAGIGLNAGPSTGTSANEISRPQTTLDKMLATCKNLAGKKADYFKTQLTSIIYGNNDFIVSTIHDTNNAQIMSTIYGAQTKSTFDTKKLEGTATDGTGTLFSDSTGPRISLIMNTNLGHNWPAGQGGNGGNFINKKSINYPAYLAKFFFENNRRSKNVVMPKLVVDPVTAENSKFFLTGKLSIAVQKIKSIEVSVIHSATNMEVDRFPLEFDSLGNFKGVSKDISNGEYLLKILTVDINGLTNTITRLGWMGDVPGTMPPQVVNIAFESLDDCLLMHGQAVANGGEKIEGVYVVIDRNTESTTVAPSSVWYYEKCGLTDGTHELSVFAKNMAGAASNQQSYKFRIEKGSATATLQQHMEAHRLPWEQYGLWYKKYGNTVFTIYQKADHSWSDQHS